MTHYEALGIPTDATADDVRRAYLRLAREHHPDRHAASPGNVVEAERRMREVNAAWAVLGDPGRRAEYDRRSTNVGTDGAPGSAQSAPDPVRHRPSTEFTPYHEFDEDDDDSWRYEPDEFDPDTAVGRVFGATPPLLLLVGLGLLGVSLVVGFAPLTALAVACVALAVVLFIGAPMVAVFKSQIHEERRRGGSGAGR
jgi:hypothetical protein